MTTTMTTNHKGTKTQSVDFIAESLFVDLVSLW